jgi:hypothetical protein
MLLLLRKFCCFNFQVLQTTALGSLRLKNNFVLGNALEPKNRISKPQDICLYFISTFT